MITEANRQKVAQSQLQTRASLSGPVTFARPGQPAINQYFTNMNNGNTPASSLVNPGTGKMSETPEKNGELNGKSIDKPVDEESKKGRFGWFDIEKVFLPMIFRYGTEKFTSVRMVERKLLNRFLQVLPPEVNNCTCIRSYYITDAESKLLNEINLKHTDCAFGKEAFTSKDLVVRLKDAKEFYKFLDLCHKKLVLKKSNASDRCGFFRINGESVVPYTMKEGIKYVPLFYFEGETEHLKLKSEKVDGWDLAYLKFCCKVQGIRNELFANDVCKVVALDEIKSHFPGGTTFEDYWPAKGSIEPVQSRHGVCAGNWTQKPAGQPKGGVGGGGQAVPNPAVNINPAYRNLQPQQLTAQQLQQIQALQGINPSQMNMNNPHVQQLLRAGLMGQASLSQNMAAALMRPQSQSSVRPPPTQQALNKTFPGKLTQIKEFPIEKSNQQPYKLQKALIDQKIVPCINVRPYVFHDLMMSLPDFVKHFFPDLPLEKSREAPGCSLQGEHGPPGSASNRG